MIEIKNKRVGDLPEGAMWHHDRGCDYPNPQVYRNPSDQFYERGELEDKLAEVLKALVVVDEATELVRKWNAEAAE
jgi:hypothetical protein